MSNTFSIGAHRVPGGSSRLMFNKGGANSVVHGTARENSTNADHIFMLGLYLSSSRKTQYQEMQKCRGSRPDSRRLPCFGVVTGGLTYGILLFNYLLWLLHHKIGYNMECADLSPDIDMSIKMCCNVVYGIYVLLN